MPHDLKRRIPHNPDTQEKENEAQRQREEYLRALRAVFHSDPGRTVLRYLRAATGVDRPRFEFQPGGRGPNPITAAFHDGRASVVLDIEKHLAIPEDAAGTPGAKR